MRNVVPHLAALLLLSAVVPAERIVIDPTMQYQVMDGFGASLTDSCAWLLASSQVVTDEERLAIFRELFDPEVGIGLSMLRQPMGTSDFRWSDYSYNDLGAGQTDYTMANFSVGRDDPYIVPMVQLAIAINPEISVFGVPWSPPAWMKTSGSMITGTLNDSDAVYDSYGLYFAKFVEAYTARGIPVSGVAPQNEPKYEPWDYPGMPLTAAQEIRLTKAIGRTFANRSIATKIMIYEHNWDNTEHPDAVLSDPEAGAYAAGSSFHCYNGNVSAQTTIHDLHPEKKIYFTECTGHGASDWSGFNWAMENLIIGGTRNWASAVFMWNMVLDETGGPKMAGGCSTCRGLMTWNWGTRQFTREPEYYAMAHIAKFVRPGARRIESSAASSVAFQNPDGRVALLMQNQGGSSRSDVLAWKYAYANYALPAGSVATLRWSDVPGPVAEVWMTRPGGTERLTRMADVSFQAPFHPEPAAVPAVIQAEDYDFGGSTIAWNDATVGNQGGQYRNDNVDIESCAEGGYNVGWMDAGEWLEYDITVAQTGTYYLDLRVASQDGGGAVYALLDGVALVGSLPIPATGGWQKWNTISTGPVGVTTGRKTLRIGVASPGMNLNALRFRPASEPLRRDGLTAF